MSRTITEVKEQIKNDLCVRFDSVETRICPDQYVGVIESLKSHGFDRMAAANRPQNLSCVIMVLESPHIQEFRDDIGPAKGDTGKLLCQHILSVKGLNHYKQYGLLLMNAVQYQCSLGFPTKCFRDKVFLDVWDAEEFKKRLIGLFHEGDVVLNCCTKGLVRNHLRNQVQGAIEGWKQDNASLMGVPLLRRTHPSSWYSEKNRKAEWIFNGL